MKRKKLTPDPPKVTTRWQPYQIDIIDPETGMEGWQHGHCRVTLMLWPNRHTWFIVQRDGDKVTKWARVQVDRPLSQDELNRWLAKTQPIE